MKRFFVLVLLALSMSCFADTISFVHKDKEYITISGVEQVTMEQATHNDHLINAYHYERVNRHGEPTYILWFWDANGRITAYFDVKDIRVVGD